MHVYRKPSLEMQPGNLVRSIKLKKSPHIGRVAESESESESAGVGDFWVESESESESEKYYRLESESESESEKFSKLESESESAILPSASSMQGVGVGQNQGFLGGVGVGN